MQITSTCHLPVPVFTESFSETIFDQLMSEFRVFLQQNLDVLFVILRALDAAEQDGGDVVVEIVVGSLLFHFENIDNFSLCLRENVRQSTMG